jgi:hypothetical protein
VWRGNAATKATMSKVGVVEDCLGGNFPFYNAHIRFFNTDSVRVPARRFLSISDETLLASISHVHTPVTS